MPGSSKLTSYCTMRNFHLGMTALWGVLAIPTLLWWKDSVPWVALMSLYANLIGHWAAWQASRAEDAAS